MKRRTWVLIVASTAALAGCSMITDFLGGSTDGEKKPGGSGTPTAVEKPLIDGAASGTKALYRGQRVAILSNTVGATIHYTLDEAEPSSASPLYSAALLVKKTTTIKAVAVKAGMTDSPVSTVTFSLDQGPLETVSLDASAMDFSLSSTSPTVSLASSEAMTKVRYVFQGFEASSPLPLVVADDLSAAPSATSAVSLSLNAHFPNGKWELREIRIDTAAAEHRYLYSQAGNDDPNLVATYDHGSRAPGATAWPALETAVYLDGGRPSLAITGAASGDAAAPTVSSVAISGSLSGQGGRYKPGDILKVTVTASEASAIANMTVKLLPKDLAYQQWGLPGQLFGSIDGLNFFGFLEDIEKKGPGVYEATLTLGDYGFPFDLYPVVTVDDIWRNEATYYCDAGKADLSAYSVSSAGYASTGTSQDGQSNPQGSLPIPSIPFASTAFAAAAASPAAPGEAWHDFSLVSGGMDAYAYSVVQGTRYYFQTNDGNGGGGTNSATGMKYSLLNADYRWESYGPTGNYNAAQNARSFIASQTGNFYVIARMNGSTGSTAAHRLMTTAPTAP
jgi:hypothetical protein